MFRSFCVVSKAVVTGSSRSYARRMRNPNANSTFRPTRGDNPGADHTVRMLKKEGVVLSNSEVDFDMIDEANDADFFDAHKAYDQHEKEMRKKKEDLPKHIVKNKYFDDAAPNLLTWSEKEQIRFLHSKDPNEWTPKKISESFPVTESSAKKIIKVTWKPASQSRIERHDASALRNWRELKEGTLYGVTPEMKEHFLKFTKRVLPPRSHENVEKTLALGNKSKPPGEYESLLQIETNENTNAQLKIDAPKKEKNILKTSNNYQSSKLTLDQLRESISDRLEKNAHISDREKKILKPDNDIKSLVKDESKTYLDSLNQAPKSVEKFEEDKKEIVHHFTKRIRIPKKAYRRDGTYKVQDAFYDSDGTFLYRVPGLVANFSNTNPDVSSSGKE